MTNPSQLDLEAIRKRCAEVGSTTSIAQRDRRDLLAEVERLRPRVGSDGSTHWEGCWEARGHHDCALAEIERLKAEREQGEPEFRTDPRIAAWIRARPLTPSSEPVHPDDGAALRSRTEGPV